MSLTKAICLISFCLIVAERKANAVNTVPIRIVREVASYGAFGNVPGPQETRLVARTKPLNFSGPGQLRRLVGKCFNYTAADYRYTVCPFQNVTQIEESYRWNAYRGVLGVWRGWKIVNNTFAAMLYDNGDRCGDRERSVEVELHCGEHDTLTEASEPSRCRYTATLSTPLVCHRDALLVYPRLSRDLRRRWDRVEQELFEGDLTQKGYEEELEKLFVDAGFVKRQEEEKTEKAESKNEKQGSASTSRSEFSDVTTCFAAYEQLRQEAESLRRSLESYRNGTENVANGTCTCR